MIDEEEKTQMNTPNANNKCLFLGVCKMSLCVGFCSVGLRLCVCVCMAFAVRLREKMMCATGKWENDIRSLFSTRLFDVLCGIQTDRTQQIETAIDGAGPVSNCSKFELFNCPLWTMALHALKFIHLTVNGKRIHTQTKCSHEFSEQCVHVHTGMQSNR